MRVALLSDCYLPRLGGIEVQVHDLASALVAAGHEVEVFTATPGPAGERHGAVEVLDGVRVHRMAARMPWELPVNPWAPREVRRRLVAGRFDVAHAHLGVVSPFATDLTTLALDLHLPTVLTWHCALHHNRLLLRVLGHARRWARRGAAFTAVSSLVAGELGDVVGRATPVGVLPNGIDVATWRPTGPRRRAPGEPVRVVSAIRLAGRKRPGALVEVMHKVRRLLPPEVRVELDVFGEGPLRGPLERLVAARGLQETVRLPGRASREELVRWYHDADVYVAPGRLEAFGIAALEARTAGLPVVGVAGSGVRDFVTDGVNGFLAADDDEMAHQVARLVRDGDLRDRIARHNAGHPPEQAWPRVVEQVVAAYAGAAS